MEKDLSAEGLRGLAALNVFLAHFFLAYYPLGFVHYFPWVAQPATTSGIAERILSLPLLSAAWNGSFAVCIFFVLSGYVLTKNFHATGKIELIRSLAARRYTRLGIPIFASVMLAFSLYLLGAYQAEPVARITGSSWLASQSIGHPTFLQALRDGVYGVVFQGSTQFNTVFWTMRVEFIGSMLIFAYSLLAWPGRRSLYVTAVYIVSIFFFMPGEWPYYLAFLIGSHLGQWKPDVSRWVSYGSCVIAFYLASADSSSMFTVLNMLPLDPGVRVAFYNVVAGALVLLAVRTSALDWILLRRTTQFLGRISYPFYLVHAPIIMTLGCYLFLRVQDIVVRTLAVGISFVASLAATVLLATLFERCVDQPAIRFGKWLTRGDPTAPVGGAPSKH